MVFMFVLMAVVMVPIGIYMYFYVKRALTAFKVPTDKKQVKIITAVAVTAIMAACLSIFNVSTIIILHIMFIAMATQLANFIIKKISKEKYDGLKIWKMIYNSGIIPLVITVVLIIYGYNNMMNVTETDYTVYTQKDIREEGYRVVLIADLHFGVSIDVEELQEKCDEIGNKKADIVVLCGDIVDENTTKEGMQSAFETLGTIENTYGIYFVYGNHDRQPYSQNKNFTTEELDEAIESAGINILSDETVNITDDLTLIGREDASITEDSGRKTIEELMENVDKEDYLLVLDHKPTQYEENSAVGTDLLLSGHTHAGQIWPANIFFKILKFDDAVYGRTELGDMQALVTSGIAGWGYPIKTSSPAEYVIIDIKQKK